MDEFQAVRDEMVERQLVARGIRNPRVLAAMREVPRHVFVPGPMKGEAYQDSPLPIGEGQTISQPYMVAIMTELLDLQGHERVLEIGSGSGYQAAVLSRLCRWVYTIERVPSLGDLAKRATEACGYANITIRVDDGTQGWPEEAPFDGIIVTAGSPKIPETLVEQLGADGKMLIPVGNRLSQTLKRVIKKPEGMVTEDHTACRFVDLIGEFGWS
jgi:protein-L-isoaspartate(D-aspartate) O-methyltransferase